jgi:hypothetical protein
MLSKQTAFTQQLASGPMLISNCCMTLRMQSQNQSGLQARSIPTAAFQC